MITEQTKKQWFNRSKSLYCKTAVWDQTRDKSAPSQTGSLVS